jgi:hypothetical protein
MTEWEEKVLSEKFTAEVCQIPLEDSEDIISNLQLAEQAGNIEIFGDGENKTVWILVPENMTRCSLHTCTDGATGVQLIRSLRKIIKHIWENTEFKKIEGRFTDKRERALMKRVGAKQEGVCRKSFLKQGELIDEYIYGLCKEDK